MIKKLSKIKLWLSSKVFILTNILLCLVFYAQAQKQIKGNIQSETGFPLTGVTIIIKGTITGTISDVDGNYEISVPENATLIFSFIGYLKQEISVTEATNFNIVLQPDVLKIEEVVVVGYGETKKESLTGAISTVKGADLIKSPQPNLSNSFSGRTPGVIGLNRTGEPGYDDATLLIRGMSTTGDNSPLVVIDGVANRAGGLNRLNSNDIESISVLKDASAAIYGAQAANGVILITTKRGTKGKPVFDFSYNQGFTNATRLPKMANAATFATILNEINYYNSPSGGLNQIYSVDEITKFGNGSDLNNYPNTDWIKETIKNIAYQNQQNISVRGGSEGISYFASLGRINQQSIYKDGVTNYQQVNLRVNLDINLTKNLRIGLDLNGRNEERNFPVNGSGNIFRSIYRTFPTVPARYTNGLPSLGIEGGANPVVIVTDIPGTDKQPTFVINGTINGEYKIPFVKGLSVIGFYSQDKIFSKRKLFAKPYTLYQINNNTVPVSYNSLVYSPGSGTPELTEDNGTQTLTTSNIRLAYEKTFGKHFLKAFIAYEQQKNNTTYVSTKRTGFLTTQIPQINLGGGNATNSSNSGYETAFTRRNIFGRLSYDFNDKYLLEAQFRYDGSSNFAKGHRYGFFPSISAGWRISEEDWFNVSSVDNLKLRASYGLLGNDRINPFQFLNSFSQRSTDFIYADGTPIPIFIINQLANPSITWETARKLDIGLEMRLMKKITIELDYFSETRNNLLTPRQGSLPLVSGLVNERDLTSIIPQENIGEIKNAGIEALIKYNQSFGLIKFFTSGNITYNKSKVVFLDDTKGIPDYQLRKDKPIGSDSYYQAIGIFRTQADLDKYPHFNNARLGDLILEDANKDGQITALDKVRQSLTNVPQIIYGLTIGANYKSFDISILLQGQGRVQQYVLPEAGSVGNFFSSWADNRWSPNNPNGTYPRVDTRTSSSINGGLNPSTFWIQNTSFLRIKNIEIGYNLPKNLLDKLKFQALRVYANGFNLATFTKVKDFDPEGSSGSAQFYPQQRIFNLGVNAQF